MTGQNHSNWFSYLLFGGIAVVLSWVTSGCRLGSSQVVNPPNPDQISGYYVIQPQTLTFYANTAISSNPANSTQSTFQKSAPVSLVPAEITQIFSNPVAVLMDDLSTGAGHWVSPTTRATLPIQVGPDLALSLRGSTSPVTLWSDPNCTSNFEISESGQLTRSIPVQAIPGNTLPLSGTAQLTIQGVNLLQGDCSATLQDVATCLGDVTQCGGSSMANNIAIQGQILGLFGPWLQAQAFGISDIPNLTNFSYEVVFD